MPVIINTNQDFSDIQALLGNGDNVPQKINLKAEQNKRPKTTLIAAISKDGYLAQDANDKLKWVPKEDQLWFRKKTIEVGHLIIGKKTFDLLPKKALEHRSYWVYTHQVEHGHVAVLDENIYFVNMAPAEFLQYLGKKGIKQVAIVGGKTIYDMFLYYKVGAENQCLVDEVYLSIVNHLLGKGIKFDIDFIKGHFTECKENANDIGKFGWGERIRWIKK